MMLIMTVFFFSFLSQAYTYVTVLLFILIHMYCLYVYFSRLRRENASFCLILQIQLIKREGIKGREREGVRLSTIRNFLRLQQFLNYSSGQINEWVGWSLTVEN